MQVILYDASLKTTGASGLRVCFGDCDPLGIGLMDAKAQARRPLRTGDAFELWLRALEGGSNSVTLAYEGKKEDILCVAGVAMRGLFRQTDKGMIASDIRPLKEAPALYEWS